MQAMKDETHLKHFKYLYCFTYLFSFKFFRELLASKGPALKFLIEKGETEGFGLNVISPPILKGALQKDFPDWYDWFPSFIEQLKLLPNTLRTIDATTVTYDEEANTVRISPGGIAQSPTGGLPQLPPAKNVMEQVGPPIWKDLHTFAKKWEGDVEEQNKFLDKIRGRIPCGVCKQFWINELKTNPAPTSSTEDFFKWTFEVHNKVNVKLEKPELTLEEASALY